MIRWTGLAPREFEFPFPGSLGYPLNVHLYNQVALVKRTSAGVVVTSKGKPETFDQVSARNLCVGVCNCAQFTQSFTNRPLLEKNDLFLGGNDFCRGGQVVMATHADVTLKILGYPRTLNPYTLHPTPYTLHPTP